jgi:hypothetical protein
MSGIFSQNGGHVPLALTRGEAPEDANLTQGDWRGTLVVSIPLVFHLNAEGGGTNDSPQQNSFNIPNQYTVSGNSITITIPSLSVTYTASLAGNKMTGTFIQNGQSIPLELTKQ